MLGLTIDPFLRRNWLHLVWKKEDQTLNGGYGVNIPVSESVYLKVVHLQACFQRQLQRFKRLISSNTTLVLPNFGGKDSDRDGVYDQYDDCPSQPGLPAFNGCPDNDGDVL